MGQHRAFRQTRSARGIHNKSNVVAIDFFAGFNRLCSSHKRLKRFPVIGISFSSNVASALKVSAFFINNRAQHIIYNQCADACIIGNKTHFRTG